LAHEHKSLVQLMAVTLMDRLYIWQQARWPQFQWQQQVIDAPLKRAEVLHQRLLGQLQPLPKNADRDVEMDALIQNAIRSSAIEGENLNVESVRSSVARQLGVQSGGLDKSAAKATRQTELLVQMLREATANVEQGLSTAQLCQWQAALFSEQGLRDIGINQLRGEAPMQVVSYRGPRETIHFEAPARSDLEPLLDEFIQHFNQWASQAESKRPQGIIRAAIMHLWLITLHPFDDGNGRVTRAVTDRALAQFDCTSIRFYAISAAIEKNRTAYYNILETTQSCCTPWQAQNPLDITDWLSWFIGIFIEAQEQALIRVERILKKANFWQRHAQTSLIPRQIKVLNRLLDAEPEEFNDGIAARHYQGIASVSKATATRDLADLQNKHCLAQTSSGGRSTRYVIAVE
jgi:Fic family protein